MDGQPPPEEDFSALSISQCLDHKNWKARVHGYEALIKSFKSSSSDSDPAFQPYLSHPDTLKKMVSDSNAVAQEKGVEAVVNFVRFSGENASKTREVVVPTVVEKCLGSSRSGTKTHALELILLYVEVCNSAADIIVEVLPGLSAKQPKTVAGTVLALKEVARFFDNTVVPPAGLLKALPKMFAHTDKNVRTEAFQLTQSLYQKLGPAIEPALTDLKPVQVKELHESFESMDQKGTGKGTFKPERLTRNQQRQHATQEDDGQPAAPAEEETLPDPRSLFEEVDITTKLPPNFQSSVLSSKWKDRKEALDDLLALLRQTPRIKDAPEISNVVKALSGRMTDANVNCVMLAAACLECIAKGLMTAFAKYADVILKPMLERLKERKQSVIDAISAALDALFESSGLSTLLDDIVSTLGSKNPQVKENTLRFLTRCLSNIKHAPSASEVKTLSESAVALLEDSHEAARNEAASCLGTLMKIVGERALNQVMEPVAEVRKVKVKEAYQHATVKCKSGSSAPQLATTHSTKQERGTKTTNGPSGSMQKYSPTEPKVGEVEPPTEKGIRGPPARLLSKKAAPTQSKQGPAKTTVPAQGAAKKTIASAPLAGKVAPPADSQASTSALAVVKFKRTPEESDLLATELIPTSIATDLADANWKTRLAALEEMHVWMVEQIESLDSEVLFRFLGKKGWAEKNFQVSAKLYTLLASLAEKCPSFSRSSAALAIPHLSEKLGDIKLKKPAGDTLLLFAEKTSLAFVLTQAYDTLAKQKAPKVLADSIAWIDSALTAFGVVGIPLRALIEFLKAALKNSNAAVRSSATKTLVTVKVFAGGGIKDFLEDLNPQLLATIVKEFEQVEGQSPPEPTRFSVDFADLPQGKGATTATDSLAELFPRVDIDRLVAGTTILVEAKSDSWKARKEALESLLSILDAGNNKRLKPSMGDLTQVLKSRILDTNKACQLLTLEVISKIAAGMNKPFERYAKVFIVPVTSVLADQKANIRAAAISTLSEIATACEGIDPIVQGLATGLEVQNPLQRSSLLSWITQWLEAHPPVHQLDLSSWVAPVIACLDDRSGDVRRGAQAILPLLIRSVGYERVVNETNSLKPASRNAVLPLLQSSRGVDLPSPHLSATPPMDISAGAASSAVTAVAAKVTGLRGRKIGGSAARNIDGRGDGEHGGSENAMPPNAVKKLSSASALFDMKTTGIANGTMANGQSQNHCPFTGSNLAAKKTRLAKDTSRWIIETSPIRKDILDSLQQQMSSHISADLLGLLFNDDHNAIDGYMEGMSQISGCYTKAVEGTLRSPLESTKAILLANSDLSLKYACTKVHEPQPNLIGRSLDVVDSVIAFWKHVDYQIQDNEALCFVPTLIYKLGDPRETVRIRVQLLLQSLPRVYASSRLFALLLEHGLHSKVAKTRQGTLDELAGILKRTGMAACESQKVLPIIGAFVSDKDTFVRKAALSVMSEAHALMGETFWLTIQLLSEKDKSQIEDRIRHSNTAADGGQEETATQEAASTSRSASPAKLAKATRLGLSNPTGGKTTHSGPLRHQARPESPSLGRAALVVGKSVIAKPSIPMVSGIKRTHLPSRLARPPSRQGLPKQATETQNMNGQVYNGGQDRAFIQPSVPDPSSQPPSTNEELVPKVTPAQTEDIGIIISNILSNDATRSVEALKKIQKILERPEHEGSQSSQLFQNLADHAEGLVETITVQVSHVFDRVDDLVVSTNFRLAKHLMQTLHSFFTHNILAESLTVDTVSSLLEELTLRLLQTDESTDSNVKEISKFINLILLKIFATGRRITVFRALFALLLKIVKPFPSSRTQTESQEAKVAELVLKCIWKLARNIPMDLEKQYLDPAEVFPAIEHALQSIPPNDWRARATNKVPCGDMPLRTIKVIIQHVVAKFGDRVYDHLSHAFDDPSATIVYPYVYRILNSPGRSELPTAPSSAIQEPQSATSLVYPKAVSRPTSEQSLQSNNRASSSSLNVAETSSQPVGTSAEDDPDTQLILIINHISSETTGALHKEGITELHQFLKAYPHKKGKVDKLLEATGPAFRKYLARALASRAAEDEERDAAVADTLSRLEAVQRDPNVASPRRSSGTSEGTTDNAEKLSRLHDIFQYRTSRTGSLADNPVDTGKT